MTTKSKAPSPDVLPLHLAVIPAVAEAAEQCTDAQDATRAAEQAAREAQAALEAAPRVDEEALQAAVAAGKPNPQPTEPIREAEAKEARKRVKAARTLGRKQADHYRAVLVEHRDELDALQAPRVDDAASAIAAALDTLAGLVDTYAREVGIWRGLYAVTAGRESTPADDRARMMGREPGAALPKFGAARNAGAKQLAAVRATVEELKVQPTPAPDKVAERLERRRQRRERLTGKAA